MSIFQENYEHDLKDINFGTKTVATIYYNQNTPEKTINFISLYNDTFNFILDLNLPRIFKHRYQRDCFEIYSTELSQCEKRSLDCFFYENLDNMVSAELLLQSNILIENIKKDDYDLMKLNFQRLQIIEDEYDFTKQFILDFIKNHQL